jgi:hypothetical protein
MMTAKLAIVIVELDCLPMYAIAIKLSLKVKWIERGPGWLGGYL